MDHPKNSQGQQKSDSVTLDRLQSWILQLRTAKNCVYQNKQEDRVSQESTLKTGWKQWTSNSQVGTLETACNPIKEFQVVADLVQEQLANIIGF